MNTRARCLIALAFLLPMPAPVARAEAADGKNLPTKAAPCTECLRIRLGVPYVARGPAPNTVDNTFSVIRLPNGRFRGFTANANSYAIDGSHPWDMGGPARTVLGPGKPGSYNSCGQWLNHAEPVGSTILGFIHDETACRYELGQTHKSMSLATSSDYGLTWKNLGQILTGSDAPAAGKNTGEGDCTAVDGHDGYYYAYCRRNRDHMPYVARTPTCGSSGRRDREISMRRKTR